MRCIAHASIRRSDVFEVDNKVVSGRNDTVHRAGTIMRFEFIVRDKVREFLLNHAKFGNLRGNGYDDVLEINATLNNAAESSMVLSN